MKHLQFPFGQTGTSGLFTTATFTVTSVASATTGTLLWGGGATGTITLAAGDITTTSNVASKIAATGAGGGWTVTAQGTIITLVSTSPGSFLPPTIVLGTATNITFSAVSTIQAPSSSINPVNVGINFTNGQFESSLTGWATYADAAGITPIDGTGGSPTVTLAANTSTPLTQTTDAILTKGASNLQGNGFSYDFTLDRGVVNTSLTFTFTYSTSVNYASTDMGVFLYDKTNNTLIPLSSTDLPSTVTGISNFYTTFLPTSSLQYRLIFHIKTTNASAYTFEIDNIQLRTSNLIQGAAISDWVSYTPTISAVTTPPSLGTNTQSTRWRRVGNMMEIEFIIKQTGAGSAGSGVYLFPLPTGYTIDTSKYQLSDLSNNPGSNIGDFDYWISGTGNQAVGWAVPYTTTQFGFPLVPSSSGSGSYWGSGQADFGNTTLNVSFRARFQCSQFSINSNFSGINEPIYISNSFQTVGSDDTGGNTYIGMDGSLIPSFTAIHFRDCILPRSLMPNEIPELQVRSKIDGSWVRARSAIIPSLFLWSGLENTIYYDVSGSTPGNNSIIGIGISNTTANQLRVYFSADFRTVNGAWIATTVTGRSWANVTSAADGYDRWRIVIKNPNAAIEVSPKVIVRASRSTGQSLTANVTDLSFDVKTIDTNSSFGTTTFTAPVTGYYQIFIGSIVVNTASVNIQPYIGGTLVTGVILASSSSWSGGSSYGSGSSLVFLNTGNTLTLRGDSSITISANFQLNIIGPM